MKRAGWWKAIVVVAAVACSDARTPAEGVAESPREGAPQVGVANRMAYVGQLHNAMMDDYRRHLRRGAKTYARPCEGVLAWFKTARLPAGLRQGLSSQDIDELAVRASSGTRSCRDVAERVAAARRGKVKTAARFEGDTISDAAVHLLEDVQNAMSNLHSATALDGALAPIITAANALDSASADAVLSAAAVASSSAHYWETNYVNSAVALLPVSDGGECQIDCEPQQWEMQFRMGERPGSIRQVMFNPLTLQGQGCLAELIASTGGWSEIAKADLWGAIGAVVLEKQFDWRGFTAITTLASASQMSWHQLWLVACYVM